MHRLAPVCCHLSGLSKYREISSVSCWYVAGACTYLSSATVVNFKWIIHSNYTLKAAKQVYLVCALLCRYRHDVHWGGSVIILDQRTLWWFNGCILTNLVIISIGFSDTISSRTDWLYSMVANLAKHTVCNIIISAGVGFLYNYFGISFCHILSGY